jgi:hypothetical protein
MIRYKVGTVAYLKIRHILATKRAKNKHPDRESIAGGQ